MATTTPAGHGLGRVPDLGDIRDHPLLLAAPAALPASVDLRPHLPPVGDQGAIGSCTAWASTGAWRAELVRQGNPDMEPSELAQYYWTRSLEGSTRSDAGASIRDAIKTLAKVGAAPEAAWPYDVAKVLKAPPAAVRKAAKVHMALEYQAVPQSPYGIKSALAGGYGVVFGCSVYASFESSAVAHGGVVPMPGAREQLLGGHALCIVGHDDARAVYIVRNSWGLYGDQGYLYMPYAYVESPKLSSDFWIIKAVAA